MGSGYNDSLAASRSARSRASTRTPISFYLSVPMYEYDLGCGTENHIHTFQSRTPMVPVEDDENSVIVWCESCQRYTVADNLEPLNRSVTTDEIVSYEQDKGILRERIALLIQAEGFVDNDEDIARLAVEFGVPVLEIKRINAGLRAPDGLSGLPDMCNAGLHEMTGDNIAISHGRRQCKACRTIAQRKRRAEKRK